MSDSVYEKEIGLKCICSTISRCPSKEINIWSNNLDIWKEPQNIGRLQMKIFCRYVTLWASFEEENYPLPKTPPVVIWLMSWVVVDLLAWQQSN